MMLSGKNYWEDRLSNEFSLTGVGDRRLNQEYNAWLYKGRKRSLKRALEALKLDVSGKQVLDVGAGTGFFVDYWLRRRAGALTGLDITEVSIDNLRNRFPSSRFLCADVSSESLNNLGTFDIISAFDVLFHIADDSAFERALANIRQCCKQDAFIFITDHLPAEDVPLTAQESHRSYDHYKELGRSLGLEIVYLSPVFYLMTNPLTLEEEGLPRRLLWSFIYNSIRAGRRLHLDAVVGNGLGFPLYMLDGFLTQAALKTTTLKLLVFKAE